MLGNPTRPATEAVLTIAPLFCLSIMGISYLMHSQVPLRLLVRTRSQLLKVPITSFETVASCSGKIGPFPLGRRPRHMKRGGSRHIGGG
jgi:hypothetical protein